MRCPNCGSNKISNGYCDDCGALVDSAQQVTAAPSAVLGTVSVEPDPAWHPEITECPSCGAARSEIAPFCELCRFNFETMQPSSPLPVTAISAAPKSGPPVARPAAPAAEPLPGPTTPLVAIVQCDPALYAEPIEDVLFPDPAPGEERFVLVGETLLIGRHSRKHVNDPQVMSNTDSGVSSIHCELTLRDDGTYIIEDRSKNGTLLNDVEIQGAGPRPLKAGDELVIGFWTRIRIEEATPPA